MPDSHPRPQQFDSIQQYLDVVGFITNSGYFVCGEIRFPITAIRGHTPTTFADKMREQGWMPTEVQSHIKWPLA